MNCIYCDRNQADTTDHVPPKLVFPRPLPSNLITVPSCEACNAGFQRDDDYFGAVMAMRVEIEPHRGGDEVVARLLRNFDRPESRGLTERMIAATTTKAVYARDDGRYLGEAAAFEIENGRVNQALCRIVRGLFYHETNSRLGDDTEVVADLAFGEDPAEAATIMKALAGQPVRTVGHSFAYSWKLVDASIQHSAWLLQFYERVPFFVLTAHKSALELDREHRTREA